MSRKKQDDGTEQHTGSILVSRLARHAVLLRDDKRKASTQGVTVELHTGHVAFVHIADSAERAGDQQLHPAPWEALKIRAGADEQKPTTVVSLPMKRDDLLATPSLVEVILQDPLYRPMVYGAFSVPPPPYDRS